MYWHVESIDLSQLASSVPLAISSVHLNAEKEDVQYLCIEMKTHTEETVEYRQNIRNINLKI